MSTMPWNMERCDVGDDVAETTDPRVLWACPVHHITLPCTDCREGHPR